MIERFFVGVAEAMAGTRAGGRRAGAGGGRSRCGALCSSSVPSSDLLPPDPAPVKRAKETQKMCA
jgi:hypothetical protein